VGQPIACRNDGATISLESRVLVLFSRFSKTTVQQTLASLCHTNLLSAMLVESLQSEVLLCAPPMLPSEAQSAISEETENPSSTQPGGPAFPAHATNSSSQVSRDRSIEKLRKNHDLGSGYPSDSKTMGFIKVWISQNGDVPIFVRKSWKPIKILLGKSS